MKRRKSAKSRRINSIYRQLSRISKKEKIREQVVGNTAADIVTSITKNQNGVFRQMTGDERKVCVKFCCVVGKNF